MDTEGAVSDGARKTDSWSPSTSRTVTSRASGLELEQIEFELRGAVESILDAVSPRAHEKGLELNLLIDRDTPRNVRGDPTRIRQIILNLANNAVKFTDQGHITIRVRCVKRDGDRVWIRFEVHDTGCGVSPEVRPRLFRPFSQADASTTRKFGGTGLGLAICHRLTQLMGGDIDVETDDTEGSTFWFQIPMRFDAQSIPAPGDLDTATRAVIVDPLPSNQMALSLLLAECGVASERFSLGRDAMPWLERNSAATTHVFVRTPPTGEAEEQFLQQVPVVTGARVVGLTTFAEKDAAADSATCHVHSQLMRPVKLTALKRALNPVVPTEQIIVPAKQEAPSDERDADKSALTILIVDDNVMNQNLVAMMLTTLGHSSVVAANGEQALEALDGGDFDMVFMDCQMPVLDGFSATREIRRRESGSEAHIPIVALTANAMEGDRERCVAAGMDGFITKPVRQAELGRAIDERVHGPLGY